MSSNLQDRLHALLKLPKYCEVMNVDLRVTTHDDRHYENVVHGRVVGSLRFDILCTMLPNMPTLGKKSIRINRYAASEVQALKQPYKRYLVSVEAALLQGPETAELLAASSRIFEVGYASKTIT